MTKEQTIDLMKCAKGKMECKDCSCRSAETVKGITCGIPDAERTKIKAKFAKENAKLGKTTYTLKAKKRL